MSDRYPNPNPRVVRLSVSLDAALLAWVRAQAKEHGVPMSWVVAKAIKDRMEREQPE